MKKLMLIICIVFIVAKTNAQKELWGITSAGGQNGVGVIFKTDGSGDNFTIEYNFDVLNGSIPSGALIQATDGTLYGMTSEGGLYGYGVIFQYDPVTASYLNKYDFDNSNGRQPSGSLLKALDGKFYGMTYVGGVGGESYLGGLGTLFQFDPATSTLIKKVDFDVIKGDLPFGSLIQASDGKLYGMTHWGGIYQPIGNYGVLFQYDPETSIYIKKIDFDAANGAHPIGSLIQASDGKIYGMTSEGGVGFGNIFQYNILNSTILSKYEFDNTNGQSPFGALIQASDGNLYGLTRKGGLNNFGVLFQFNISTSLLIRKFEFDGTINGQYPNSSLIQASNGKFYGMTSSGGVNNKGVLFQFDPTTSIFTKKLDFDGSNGSNNTVGGSAPDLIEINKPIITNTIVTSSVNSVNCAGSSLTVPYIATSVFGAANVFTAQLSDASGSFSVPVNIGTYSSTISGSINVTLPVNTVAGSAYRIRIISDKPRITGSDNGVNISINAAPNVIANASVSSLCTGGSTTLSGSGAFSYVWSSGVTNGISFVPSSTTTYTVIGTDENTCSNSATITITVNSPVVTANASFSTVCAGSSTTLTGGGAVSYIWTGGITDGNSFVPPLTATYTVTGTDANTCSNTASITITVNSLPTVTANATVSTLCAGGSTTLSGGGALSYAWSGGITNGVSFIPTSTTIYTVAGTDANTCTNTALKTITVNVLPIAPTSGGDQITTSSPTPTLSATPPTGSDVDWYSASSGGTLLLSGSNTYSTSTGGTYYAESRNTTTGCSSANRTAISLTIVIGNIWNGSAWSEGSPPGNLDAAVINGAYTISGSDLSVASLIITNTGFLIVDPLQSLIVSGNITIGSTATINGNIITGTLSVTPAGSITLNSGSTLNATGNITISSDATGDGSLINNGTLTGSAVVQRYLPSASWHLVSSTVASANNSVYTGLFMKQYDETTDSFGPFVSSTSLALTPGTGAVLWATSPNTITYNGSLNDGPVGPLTCTHNLNGYNLMGNPYPSAIDWNAASGWTRTNLSGTMWMWTQAAGQYASWNGSAGTNGGTRYLAMGQGFFVQALAGGGSLIMTKAIQVHDGISLLKSAEVTPPLLRARISGNNYSDEVVIMQADDVQAGIDFRYDSQKMMGLAEAPQLYTVKESKMFSIASIKTIDNTIQIPLNLKVGAEAEYTLNLQNNLPMSGLKMILHDNKLNSTSEVTENFIYTCQVSPIDDSDRFLLEFKSTEMGISISDKSSSRIFVWSAGQELYVDVPINETLTKIDIYDLNGRKLISMNTPGKPFELNLPAALYIARVTTDKQISNHKIVIR